VWKGLSLLVANEMGGAVKRNMTVAAYFAAAGIVAVLASVFGLLALQNWLSLHVSDTEASLIVAAGLLVVAIGIGLIGYSLKNRRKSSSELTSTALAALPLAAQLIPSRVRMGTLTLIAVLAAAALLGRQAGKPD
jgi:hypothetical protein